MTHCEKCIHYDICQLDYDLIPEHLTFFPHNEDCKQFKNKADFVEVIRCNDCKNYVTRENAPNFCMKRRTWISETDFCSYGERRDT